MKVKVPRKAVSKAPADVAEYVTAIVETREHELASRLKQLDVWRFARGDMHHWIPALDRFDTVLEHQIKQYDLEGNQRNPFTPSDKELVFEILRVLRLLMENCTSRKLFNSYDRCYSLLATSDLSILRATLYVILRPVQQYLHATPLDSPLSSKLRQRLLTLTRGWDKLKGHGWDVVALASKDWYEGVNEPVTITFYPNNVASSSKGDASVTVDLSDLPSHSHMDDLAEKAKEHKMPVDDHFAAYNALRISFMRDRKERRQLLSIRFLAMAVYVCLSREDTLSHTLFLHEPDIISQISELLPPSRDIGDDVRSAGLLVFDAMTHHKSRYAEIFAALNVNANYGVLMTLLRSVAKNEHSFDVTDAMLSLIAFVAASTAHNNLLVSAGGLLPLLDFLTIKEPIRINYIPRACGLIEAVLFNNQQGLSTFSSIDGVNTLVTRIKEELDRPVDQPKQSLVSLDAVTSWAMTPLKGMLRTIQRLMQASGGTEGLRNLVDGDLPRAIKWIIDCNWRYGNKVYSLAVNLMSTFINNEPTSLTILQEIKLPQMLYERLETSIPVSTDVLAAVPNAISAICLNESGLKLTTDHPAILDRLVSTCVSTLASDRIAQQTGGALEELARHQPPLRTLIEQAVIKVLDTSLEQARAFVIPEDQQQLYKLHQIPQDGNVPADPPTNDSLESISKVLQFFEGFLRNSAICKTLMTENNIIDQFLSMADLPCIPVRFGTTEAARHLSHVLRAIGDHDHVILIERILQSVDKGLDACSSLWQSDSHPLWLAFHDGSATEEQIQLFSSLRSAVIRLTYLGESLSNITFSHARVATSLATTLRKASAFLVKFGKLHKTAIREHAVLRSTEKITDADMIEAEVENGKESGAKFMATRIHAVSDMFFRAVARLLYVKRNADKAHANEAKRLADILADVLVNHLDVDLVEGKENSIRSFALGSCVSMLFDDRGYEGHLSTLLFVAFHKKNGMDAIHRMCTELLQGVTSESEKDGGSGSTALVLSVLSALVSPRSIDGPQSVALQTSKQTPVFSPSDLLVRMRNQLFPLIRQVWDADWLTALDERTVKLVIRGFLTVIEAKSEDEQPVAPGVEAVPVPVPVVRQRPTANQAMLDQLVDMGFGRGGAELALIRTHNNIAAATDLIISAPHIYADVPEPEAEPEPVAEAGPAEAAPAEAVAEDGEGMEAEGEGSVPAAEPAAGDSDVKMETDPPGDDIAAVRETLNNQRKEAKEGMADRAMALLDNTEDLVFQLLPAFPTDAAGISFVLQQLESLSPIGTETSESVLAARLRLAVIEFNTYSQAITPDHSAKAHDLLASIPVPEDGTSPRWRAAFLLFGEAVLKTSITISEAKLGDSTETIVIDKDYSGLRKTLLGMSMSVIRDESASSAYTLAAMRMLVVLSRWDAEIFGELSSILTAFQKTSARTRQCHPLLALIVRHAFENSSTLTAVMRREIQAWTTPNRNKVTDVNHFVRQLRQAAFRSPVDFVNAVEAECTLVDPTPSTSVFHIRSKQVEKTAETSDPFNDRPSDPRARQVLETLLADLNSSIDAARTGTEQKDKDAAMSHTGLLVSLITEVLGSYIPAKQAFLLALRGGDAKVKGIAGLLSDLVCGISLKDTAEPTREFPAESRMTLSSWGSSMIIALCSDIAPTLDIKDLAEDLVSVRKQVLDAVAKAIKESTSIVDLDSRYGRLYALGELTYRLLVSRPSIAAKQDESGTHIAKTMIEKNFVGIITAAAGEVDLNYPEIRGTLGSLLKALEHLSKMSIKWSKAEKGKPVKADDDDTDTESEESEMDYSEEEETPNLYLNSSLGRLGGAVDEDMEDEDEEDEEDDMMQFGDEAMDDMDDDTGSQPNTDDDEDDDDDEVMDGEEEEWSDVDEEEELGSVDGDVPIFEGEAVLGAPEDEDGAVPWDNDLDADNESLLTDEEEEGQYPEDELYDEDGEDMLDNEGYDEMLLDGMPEPGIWRDDSPREATGLWGWAQPEPPRPSMRAMYDEELMSALWGSSAPRPSTSTSNVAQHPLLAPPAGPSGTSRRLSRGTGGAIGLNALLRHIQLSGGSEAMAALDSIANQHHNNGGAAVRIDLTQNPDHSVSLRVGSQTYRIPPPTDSLPEDTAAGYIPQPTAQRWQEEWSIIPGRDLSNRLVMHIINRLMPEAKRLAEEEAAKKAKEEEEAEKKLKEEEEKEREEREKAAKEEAERAGQTNSNNTSATQQAADSLAVATDLPLPESRATPLPPAATDDVEMAPAEAATESTVGAASSGAADEAALTSTTELPDAGPSEPMVVEPAAEPASAAGESLARTIIQIHGRDVDITDSGIDLEFLQALPDDMRAEVVNQHLEEQRRAQIRSQPRQPRPADASGDRPADDEVASQISPEFLEALPPNIRAELLLQEAVQNARRLQDAAPPNAAPAPTANRRGQLPFDMPGFDPALLDGFEEMIMQSLGGGGMPMPPMPMPLGGLGRMGRMAVMGRRNAGAEGVPADHIGPVGKRPHRESLQLLDRAGIAALVKLLFFPEGFKRALLFRILVNLCENSTTRADLLNLLISVVQDGSGDLPAVDRSFQQMSLRGVATPKMTPKLKAPETPGPITLPIFAHLQSEHIPTFIAQRCFEALTYIVSSNQQAITFFLTEHEQAIGLRKAPSKKGKGKEKLIPQTKYPIVILLGLLDRPVLLKTNAMMEAITNLLATITRPLSTLKLDKKDENTDDKAEEKMETDPPAEAAAVASEPSTALPTTATPAIPPETPAINAPVPVVPDTAGPSTATAPQSTTLTKPPVIPANVLKLVVNCMTTGECSSRTFGNTLMLMQYLSYIPEAKDTILQEIRSKCQELGATLQRELGQLAQQLNKATGDEDTGIIAQFTSASSSQAQLLRLLKTVDFLITNKSADVDTATEELSENEQKVAEIFASFDFAEMWSQLGDCLFTIDNNENGDLNTDKDAAVLLPLVEALMVVCKYRSRRSGRSPSEPPSSAVPSGDLFVSFSTGHRRVLNTIVRNNPSLLSGSFSLLVRNPRVLDFDNKRNWFFQKLKRKRDYQHGETLQVNVRRQYVFDDSFRALQGKSGNEIKYGKLNVKFINEDGIDAGGVTREWYAVLARQIFDPNFVLFEPCAADAQTYQPNKMSIVAGEHQHLAYFRFVGRIIGKSIFDGRLLDAYFSRAFYKQILGREVDIRDLESIDPEYHKSLQWMLENDITGVIDQEFTIEDDQFGEKKIVELKEGGAKIPVTEENKGEYVRLVVSYRLDNSIKDQVKAFLDGFYDIIPRHLIQIFEPDQLELLISGMTTVDVDELKNATQMSGWKSTDPEISWFWRALRSFSQEERSRFLMFVTSSSRVPLGGFTQLQGASGIQPFQIQKLYSKDGSLPQASTCFNLLLLPKYESYEQLKEKLSFAVTETGGFGKA